MQIPRVKVIRLRKQNWLQIRIGKARAHRKLEIVHDLKDGEIFLRQTLAAAVFAHDVANRVLPHSHVISDRLRPGLDDFDALTERELAHR